MPKKYRNDLTRDQVAALYAYDPETGVFTRRVDRHKHRAGGVAGSISHGYRRIEIGGHSYAAYRLAWLLMNGEWPKAEVDHKDLDRGNDRWANLREATPSQNKRNMRARRDNPLGVKGVYRDRGRFGAKICVNGRVTYLGSHPTVEAAASAYASAIRDHHGEYGRVA